MEWFQSRRVWHEDMPFRKRLESNVIDQFLNQLLRCLENFTRKQSFAVPANSKSNMIDEGLQTLYHLAYESAPHLIDHHKPFEKKQLPVPDGWNGSISLKVCPLTCHDSKSCRCRSQVQSV